MEASGYLPCTVTGTDDSLQSRTRFVKFLDWLIGARIAPHIPVWDKSTRDDSTLARSDFRWDFGGKSLANAPRRETNPGSLKC